MTLFAIPADDFDDSRAGTAAGVKKVAGAGRAPRILIVEDEYLIGLELENRRLRRASCPQASPPRQARRYLGPDLKILILRVWTYALRGAGWR